MTKLPSRLIENPINISGERELVFGLAGQLKDALIAGDMSLTAFASGQAVGLALRLLMMLEYAEDQAKTACKPAPRDVESEIACIAVLIGVAAPSISVEDSRLAAKSIWRSYVPTLVDADILADIIANDTARIEREKNPD